MDMKLYHGDCLEVMDRLISEGVKVDAIITDPPYGTTSCKWDCVIPFDDMWSRLKLLRNDRTPIVLFGTEPFSSALRMSNIKEYKYDWVWKKPRPTNPLLAKKQPMRYVELISVFYKNQCLYNPQMVPRDKNNYRNNKGAGSKAHASDTLGRARIIGGDSSKPLIYPSNIQSFSTQWKPVHPTQKPLELMAYLIKTYTNEGDTVLDFTMGSGTTGVACKNLGRKFIGIEKDEEYFNVAKDRIGY
jgi:site-specific DNA-methyltransferase (adenine-specific)